jgi:hypothetical protein
MPFELVLFLMQKISGQGRDAMYAEAEAYVKTHPEQGNRSEGYAGAEGGPHARSVGEASAEGYAPARSVGEASAEGYAPARSVGTFAQARSLRSFAQARSVGEASAELPVLPVHASSLCACAPPPRNRTQSHEDMKMGDGTTKEKYWICKGIKAQIEKGDIPRSNRTTGMPWPWPDYYALNVPTRMTHTCGTAATATQITDYVRSLPKLGLYVLTFSVGIFRHSICVLFTEHEMIVVDHYGDNRGAKGDVLVRGEDQWDQYRNLIKELEKQNERKELIFLPIDEELKFLGIRNKRNHPTEGACEFYASNYWHIHKDDLPPPPQAKKK